MRLQEQKQQIEGNIQGQSFKIQASAKAFQVLSDRLYTNKIRAIIRELSTNALDSHIEAGKKEVPFTVHLPNELEPIFFVEDYGVGMSEKVIMELYSSYFSSDKTESNDVVGAFGLGSKSPFAYVDMFTIRSRYNGWEGTFHCYLNEEHVPSIAKVMETNTDKENGVKVALSVKENDFHRFRYEARSIFRPFQIKPEIVGVDGFEIAEYDSILEGNGWKLANNIDDDLVAVQGNVEYPLRYYDLFTDDEITEILKNKLGNDTDTEMLKDLFRRNYFVVFFKIGKLDITPSRESLSLDKRTKNNLITKIISIYKEVNSQTFKELFNDNLSRWEIFQNAYKLYKNMNLDIDFINRYKYQDAPVVDALRVPDHLKSKIEGYTFEPYTSYRDDGLRNKAVKMSDGIKESLQHLFYVSRNIDMKGCQIIFHDEPEKVRSGLYRLKQHIREEEFSALVIYDEELIDYFGISNFKFISDFDYIRRPGGRGRSSSNRSNTFYQTYHWDGSDINYVGEVSRKDFEKSYGNIPNKLYVEKYYNDWRSGEVKGNKMYFIRKLISTYETGIDLNDLYIFEIKSTEARSARVKKDNTFKPMLEGLSNMVEESLNSSYFKNELLEKAKIVGADRIVNGHHNDSYKFMSNIIPFLIERYPTVTKESDSIKNAYEKFMEVYRILTSCSEEEVENHKSKVDRIIQNFEYNENYEVLISTLKKYRRGIMYNIDSIEEELIKKYPMVQYMNGASNTVEGIDHIYDYIKLVESV